jgi:hypothetical protein
MTSRGLAIPTRTAGFLDVTFNGFGQAGVQDESDVGFVHAHPEGDGRNYDPCCASVEGHLRSGALVVVHARMVCH